MTKHKIIHTTEDQVGDVRRIETRVMVPPRRTLGERALSLFLQTCFRAIIVVAVGTITVRLVRWLIR